jgi:hypothetical protein
MKNRRRTNRSALQCDAELLRSDFREAVEEPDVEYEWRRGEEIKRRLAMYFRKRLSPAARKRLATRRQHAGSISTECTVPNPLFRQALASAIVPKPS